VPVRRLTLTALCASVLAGCGDGSNHDDACSNHDGALTNASFVFVSSPVSGDRVSSGFKVGGCSSTFEGTVNWQLVDRNGRILARGFVQAGSLDPRPFGFAVHYTVRARQVGHLTVSAPRVTSEGFPPVTNVIPLVLMP
jgi:Immunoglobulin-like domain of bacterial spore germination